MTTPPALSLWDLLLGFFEGVLLDIGVGRSLKLDEDRGLEVDVLGGQRWNSQRLQVAVQHVGGEPVPDPSRGVAVGLFELEPFPGSNSNRSPDSSNRHRPPSLAALIVRM